MTEADWEMTNDPGWMMRFLRDRSSARKLRLFACACCRENWHLLPDQASRAAVEAAEQFADDQITTQELEQAWKHAARTAFQYEDERADATLAAAYAAYGPFDPQIRGIGPIWAYSASETIADWARHCMTLFIEQPHSPRPIGQYHAQQEMRRMLYADLLREVFGTPFPRRPFPEHWRTGHVRLLATTIQTQHDFTISPMLADALFEAGCDETDLLEHLRAPTVHVRGCWAIDRIFGF